MLIKRFEEYQCPFSFCKECKKFSQYRKGCLHDDSCKAAVKLYKKYTRKGNEILKDEPPAHSERKTGKWIVDALADNIYRCSECGIDAPVEPTGGTEYKSNYCPNCGADMRGEQND